MFHTLDDYKDKNRDEKAEKDKRKTTDSYTGGKSSGIAVENPEDDDWLKKMKKHDDKEKFGKTKNKIKLTVYKNGFIGAGKSLSSVNTQGLHVDKNVTSNVDKSKPTCKVNIRLFNGEVVSEDFNLTQTFQDVINFLKKNLEVIIFLY